MTTYRVEFSNIGDDLTGAMGRRHPALGALSPRDRGYARGLDRVLAFGMDRGLLVASLPAVVLLPYSVYANSEVKP